MSDCILSLHSLPLFLNISPLIPTHTSPFSPHTVSARPQLTLPKFRRSGSRRSRGSPSPSDFGGNYSIASSGELPLSLGSTSQRDIPLDTFSSFNPNMLSVSAQQFPPGSRRPSTTPSVRSGAREPSASNSRQDAYASSRENTQSPVLIGHSISGHSIGGVPGTQFGCIFTLAPEFLHHEASGIN